MLTNTFSNNFHPFQLLLIHFTALHLPDMPRQYLLPFPSTVPISTLRKLLYSSFCHHKTLRSYFCTPIPFNATFHYKNCCALSSLVDSVSNCYRTIKTTKPPASCRFLHWLLLLSIAVIVRHTFFLCFVERILLIPSHNFLLHYF